MIIFFSLSLSPESVLRALLYTIPMHFFLCVGEGLSGQIAVEDFLPRSGDETRFVTKVRKTATAKKKKTQRRKREIRTGEEGEGEG